MFTLFSLSPLTSLSPSRLGAPYLSNPGLQKKVIVLGMDGMDPVLLKMFMDRGVMPTFTRLSSLGYHGPLATTMPPQSPVAWSSFMGGVESYDLFAQNFSVAADLTLTAPAAPFVSKLSFNSISVTWSEQLAQPVGKYLVYVDEEAVPEETTAGMLIIARNWAPKSTHSVQLAYRTTDGRVSPKSAPVTVTTYSADTNNDGLPDDWQTENWGKLWPAAGADSDGDGASNAAEFLAGTDPTSADSVLSMSISPREQGLYLVWNTLPGNFYQLQVTSDFKTWQNVGTPRFAPSTEDAAPISAPGQVQYYRVIRMR